MGALLQPAGSFVRGLTLQAFRPAWLCAAHAAFTTCKEQMETGLAVCMRSCWWQLGGSIHDPAQTAAVRSLSSVNPTPLLHSW